MANNQRYTQVGRAVYRHKETGDEFVVSWGVSYPPIDVDQHLGGKSVDDFERVGDDPSANLEDIPEPETVPND